MVVLTVCTKPAATRSDVRTSRHTVVLIRHRTEVATGRRSRNPTGSCSSSHVPGDKECQRSFRSSGTGIWVKSHHASTWSVEKKYDTIPKATTKNRCFRLCSVACGASMNYKPQNARTRSDPLIRCDKSKVHFNSPDGEHTQCHATTD